MNNIERQKMISGSVVASGFKGVVFRKKKPLSLEWLDFPNMKKKKFVLAMLFSYFTNISWETK